MNKVIKGILILTLFLVLFLIYTAVDFWQIPLFKNENFTQFLVLQDIIEPFVYVVLMMGSNVYLFKAIYFQSKKKNQYFAENELLVPAIILLVTLFFGFGLHSAGQMIGNSFVHAQLTKQHLTDFSYQVAYFIEEYPAHLLVFIPYYLLLALLAKMELNRRGSQMDFFEKIMVVVSGVVSGIIFALGNAEGGGVTLVIIPVIGYLLVRFFRLRKDYSFKLSYKPFATFWLINSLTVVLVGLALGLTIGWFTQPLSLNWGLDWLGV